MTLVKTDFGCKQVTAIKDFKIITNHFALNYDGKSENQRVSTAMRQGHSYQSLLVRFAFLHLFQGTSVLVCDRLRYAIISPVRVLRICSLHIYTTQC